MSNEAIVRLIQNGERDRIIDLWDNTKRFVRKQANASAWRSCGGYDVDDLTQSGFLAMVSAAETYEPEAGKSFVSWLSVYLKTGFAEAANRRSEKQQKDPMHSAESLYDPIPGDTDGETYLLDTIQGDNVIEATEEKIFAEKLHEDLEAVLSTIPSQNADVLRLHFFDDVDLSEIAKLRGVSSTTVGARKRDGLRYMRQQANTLQGSKLRAYIEESTNYYAGLGLRRFFCTHDSPIENTVIAREKYEKRFLSEPVLEPRSCSQWKAAGHV